MSKRLVLIGLTAATLGMVCKTRDAQAQAMPDPGRITALPQGLIGCGLLGAEAVILIEGAAGVRNRWILLGTGALGLIGGGVGGYFMDAAIDAGTLAGGRSNLPMVSTATLAVGLGLIIPTAIMYVSATMYHPEDTHTETDEGAAANVPLEESVGGAGSGGAASTTGTPSGGSTTGGTTAPATTEPAAGGGGGTRSPQRVGPEALLNFRPGQFRMGVPSLSVLPTYTLAEMHQFGVTPTTEWRVPVVTASF